MYILYFIYSKYYYNCLGTNISSLLFTFRSFYSRLHCVFFTLYPLNPYSAFSRPLLITFYLVYSRLSRINPFSRLPRSLSFTHSHLSTRIWKLIFLFLPFVTLSYLLLTPLTLHFLLILTPNISVLSILS